MILRVTVQVENQSERGVDLELAPVVREIIKSLEAKTGLKWEIDNPRKHEIKRAGKTLTYGKQVLRPRKDKGDE